MTYFILAGLSSLLKLELETDLVGIMEKDEFHWKPKPKLDSTPRIVFPIPAYY